MKPTLLKAVPQADYSFVIRKDIGHAMRNNWHYHPDYEILFMKDSGGTWLVGDYIGHFKKGDIILLGPNLPHSFRHDHQYIMDRAGRPGEAIVVLFLREVLGPSFLSLPESRGMLQILHLARKGLQLTGKTRLKVARIMDQIQCGHPGRRLISLLNILQSISEKREYKILASDGFSCQCDGVDNANINTIFEFTFNNFHHPISLEEVAALIHMGRHSFCRYFKEKTKKTYLQFLMEIKIGKACRLLIEGDMNVAEICYTCGYNSVSHFNHQFKLVKKKTPFEYKREYLHLAAAV